jgi:hypothetical protein
MKKKKFYLTMLCIALINVAFTAPVSLKDKTESWLKATEETGSGTKPLPPPEPTSEKWGSTPVGNAPLPLLLGFGLAYITMKRISKRSVKKSKLLITK